MQYQIVKQAFKLGNSAGVLLPVEWKGKKVEVKLLERSISQEILEFLEKKDLLKDTIGIFLAGSYARGEETETSDVDILIITDKTNKQTKIDKYEIIFVSKDKFEKSLKTNLYLTSLINEAKAILNNSLLEQYKNKIKGISIKSKLDEIKSIIKINEKSIEIDEELEVNVSDETLYSIILRLRELYLIKCLKSRKMPSNKEFLKLIEKRGGNEAYKAYLRIKNDQKPKKIVRLKEAKSLLEETKKELDKISNGKKK